jgi:hypothetical protein
MPASYKHYRSILNAWKDWKATCVSFAGYDVCSESELKRRAHYLGIPVAQLRWVSSYRPDPISLLERRMEALSVNPDEVVHTEPIMLRELQHGCVKCAKRERCAIDLAEKVADPDWQSWRDYCPNAATLTMLRTFQSCSPVATQSISGKER